MPDVGSREESGEWKQFCEKGQLMVIMAIIIKSSSMPETMPNAFCSLFRWIHTVPLWNVDGFYMDDKRDV